MKKVLVVGGAVIDIYAYPKKKFMLRDSNPGYITKSLGGVARNIAENLARLEIDTTLITAIGQDDGRKMILQNAQEVKLRMSGVPVEDTPTYISILDDEHDTVAAIADMDQVEIISPEDIKKRHMNFKMADYIVLDTNLNLDTLSYIFKTYTNKAIYVDVISCQKADKIKGFYRNIQGLKMNLLEARHLCGIEESVEEIAKYFIDKGVKEVYITLGKEGSVYMDSKEMVKNPGSNVETKNTAGAGDAFLAGVIYAKINELPPLLYAQKAAVLTLQDEKAVSHLMNPKNLEEVKL